MVNKESPDEDKRRAALPPLTKKMYDAQKAFEQHHAPLPMVPKNAVEDAAPSPHVADEEE